MGPHDIRFSDTLPVALDLIKADEAGLFAGDLVVVRDLYGRIRIAMEQAPQEERQRERRRFANELHRRLGAFSPGEGNLFLYGDGMFAPEALFSSPDRYPIGRYYGGTIYLLDRQVTGQEWLREPLTEDVATPPPRVTFFGLKGGVGRSTTLAVLAWRLARHGKRVLVLDLDLESPGIGSLLLPRERLPEFGVVDWFVESAVGQADAGLAAEMVASSPLIGDEVLGEILVVPAAGREEGDYLAKLSRAYVELKSSGGLLHFGDRLSSMLHTLESRHAPDVVLLDSRAGMHDIAAVTVTRLNAIALLFAVNGAYTWEAYRLLFQHWHQDRTLLGRFRHNLRVVAGLVPETGRGDYFAAFREEAYRLFSDHVYDAEEAIGEDVTSDRFSFDLNADNAPHDFLHVNWNRAFFSFDPVQAPEAVDENLLQSGFGDFYQRLTGLIFDTPMRWS